MSELHSFSWLSHSPLCEWITFCLPLLASTHPSAHPSTHQSIHPLSIHPFTHPSSIYPPTPLSYPLATTNPLSFFVDLPVWDISYKWNHVLCVLLCLLLSLSIMCSRSIHTVACVRASLLFMAESYSTVWMDPTVCICSLITC